MRCFKTNFINIFYFIILFNSIKSIHNITEHNKQKVRACIYLQQKKFKEDEEKVNEFIKNKSEIYERTPNKIILLAMAYCYNKIPYELANELLNWKISNIDLNKPEIKVIYDFENYNYDNQEMNKKIYDEFFPVFEEVYGEITDKEDRKANKNKFYVYFIHTNLFKFFVLFTLINSIIVFYIRFKNYSNIVEPMDYWDKDDKKKDKKGNNKDKENNNDNNDSNNHRKLKKKNRIGKPKKN